MAVSQHPLDRILSPLHRWVWRDPFRRGTKLLRFAMTEADGGRDLSRAAELTKDALLRRLYLHHAEDEQRHASLFRARGREILAELPPGQESAAGGFQANFFAPGERGLDDLRVEDERDASLLAFLHLSEKAAAQRFATYHEVLAFDPSTRDVFNDILRDEAFHMNYTYAQLRRVSPKRHGLQLLWARLSRLWKGYLRIATAIANVMGGIILTVQYFTILGVFAFFAKRSARRLDRSHGAGGWTSPRPGSPLTSQY
jgi:rubrerythrin